MMIISLTKIRIICNIINLMGKTAITADNVKKYKTIAKTCYAANIAYLILHVFYLVLFIISKLNILVVIDAAIIAVYLLFFLLIWKKKYYIYALCCGNLFFGFIGVTTVMTGFNTGFTFYLIGLCVVSFFTTYFSKKRGIKGSIVWVGLSMLIYLTLYFVTAFNTPYYHVEKWLEVTLFSLHSIIVFIFMASYFIVFLKYAFSLEDKIMNESRTDELTQIDNRYSLYDYYGQLSNKDHYTLAIFDIDDFKVINDTYGHVTGDYVLKEVAKIATETLSDHYVCRYGGEEFIILLKENVAKEKLEELRKKIEGTTFEFNNTKIKITITIGAVNYANDIKLEKWISLADKKMYEGKSKGKNILVY